MSPSKSEIARIEGLTVNERAIGRSFLDVAVLEVDDSSTIHHYTADKPIHDAAVTSPEPQVCFVRKHVTIQGHANHRMAASLTSLGIGEIEKIAFRTTWEQQ